MTPSTVLVTGANGYIGQAISARLRVAGYRVVGLVRSSSAAQGLTARGVTPLLGSLDDAATLTEAARAVDAVIDTASADHAEATQTFLDALAGTDKTYVRTSGTGVYTDVGHGQASDRIYTEQDPFTPADVVATRVDTDREVLAAAARGIRTIVIRPSMIYGDGASEQVPLLIRQALVSRRSLYVGAGENRWSNVYLADLAEVYLLALKKAPNGSLYNIASGEARMRDIAEAIAVLLGLDAAEACDPETAYAAFGQRWVDVALSSNSRVDSTKARNELGWSPAGPGILDELTIGSYRRLWAHKGDPHDHLAQENPQ